MAESGESKPVAVVTGGNGFIGSAIVRHLTASGHDVAVLDREGEFSADLATEADVRRVSRRVLDEYGRCDVLVHAAVAFERSTLDQLDVSLLPPRDGGERGGAALAHAGVHAWYEGSRVSGAGCSWCRTRSGTPPLFRTCCPTSQARAR